MKAEIRICSASGVGPYTSMAVCAVRQTVTDERYLLSIGALTEEALGAILETRRAGIELLQALAQLDATLIPGIQKALAIIDMDIEL